MAREQWDALVRGDGCPLCSAVASDQEIDDYGITVADLPSGRLRLGSDKYISGYCVFISRRHVREPYELSSEEQTAFFQDLMRIGRALDDAFQPAKMNFEILGNAVPHLHCHVKPRFYGDDAPGAPLQRSPERSIFLESDEYERRIRIIRGALEETWNDMPNIDHG